jgi:hypothetical protein
MNNLLYGIFDMFKRPVKFKLIGLWIFILFSYVLFLKFDSTLIKYISLMIPVPMYLSYLGYSYKLERDLEEKYKTSIYKSCSYNNCQNDNYSKINQLSHIERKITTTNTTTETMYFNEINYLEDNLDKEGSF